MTGRIVGKCVCHSERIHLHSSSASEIQRGIRYIEKGWGGHQLTLEAPCRRVQKFKGVSCFIKKDINIYI